MRKIWEKVPCRCQGQGRRRKRCSRHQSRDYPTAFGGQLWRRCLHCSPSCSRWKCPEKWCIPWRDHAGTWRGAHKDAGFLSWSEAHGKPTLEQYVKDCLWWEGPHIGAGEKCAKKRTAERRCWDHNLPSSSHCATLHSVWKSKGTKEWSWAWEKSGD